MLADEGSCRHGAEVPLGKEGVEFADGMVEGAVAVEDHRDGGGVVAAECRHALERQRCGVAAVYRNGDDEQSVGVELRGGSGAEGDVAAAGCGLFRRADSAGDGLGDAPRGAGG